MPSVETILRESGFTDEQIGAIDQRAVGAFSKILDQAAQFRDAGEVAYRSNQDLYANQIAPSLDGWARERAQILAENAALKTMSQEAGFTLPEGILPPRDAQGRYVAGAPGSTPGSPTFAPADAVRAISQGVGNATWAMQQHMRLTGAVLPDDIETLAAEADAQRLPFRDYVARKYDYAAKEKARADKAAADHDAAVERRATEAADRKWAERVGSNPDVRQAQPSRFAEVARAVKAGERPDPLTLNEEQRRQINRQQIRQDINERDSAA